MTRRSILALAVGSAAVIAVVLAVVLLSRDSEPPELRQRARSAETFVDSIGVNVHFTALDTAYARYPELIARLRELGVRHVRDAMPSPLGSPLAIGFAAARKAGIRATLLPHDPVSDPGPLIADSRKVLGNAIDAFEGPNEPDNAGDAGWAPKLLSYMPLLRQRIAELAPGTPLVGPSLVHATSRGEVLTRVPGIFNAHPYSGGAPPEGALGDAIRELEDLEQGQRRRGIVFTEAGYHNAMAEVDGQPPVTEQVAAVYIPRLLATAFGAGVSRTFLYELVDLKPEPALQDQEQHFGLLRNDLSAKPAFIAVKTMIAAIRASPGPAGTEQLPWAVAPNEAGRVERLLLLRRDGSRVLALWRPVSIWNEQARQPIDPGKQAVDLTFGGAEARDVVVWRPSVSTEPVKRLDSVRRLSLELEGDLVLVSFR